ncbi:MAG: hypothetical protein ACTHNG_00300, partial [Ginsengibacter sp.]
DPHKPGVYLLEELPDNSFFKFRNDFYKKEKKVRTRFLCQQISSRKQFLFSPITEVQLVEKEN